MSGRVAGMNGFGMGGGRHRGFGRHGATSRLIRAGMRQREAKKRRKQAEKAQREKQRKAEARKRAQQPPKPHPIRAWLARKFTGGWSDWHGIAQPAQQPTPLQRAMAEHEAPRPRRARTAAVAPPPDKVRNTVTAPAKPAMGARENAREDARDDVRQEVIDALIDLDFRERDARALAATVPAGTPLVDAIRIALANHKTR